MIRTIFLILLFPILFTSCFKEEDPIPRIKIPEGIKINTIQMGNNYLPQVYFDFGTNQVVKSNQVDEWELGFESNGQTFRIILNSGLMVAVANMGVIDFNQILIAPGEFSKKWKWDDNNGNVNLSAITNWGDFSKQPIMSKKQVFICHLGIDELGDERGYKKFMIEKFENGSYFIKHADLDGGNFVSDEIAIDTSKNYVNYSFFTGVHYFEPNKNKWDVIFTKYRETLVTDEGDSVQYSVVGTYLNPYKVEAIELDSTYMFEDISFDKVKNITLTNQKNIIGHEWKWYNIDEGYYTVYENKNYLIRDTKGFVYKFRFLSFINGLGERGFPNFEFQKLE